MDENKIIATLIIGTFLIIVGAATYEHFTKPKCEYTYDLEAKTIEANCQIADAGLYADVIVEHDGIYFHQVQRIADLNLTLVTHTNGKYVYTFTIEGYYDPSAWIIVEFCTK